jgi:hypothetical protein
LSADQATVRMPRLSAATVNPVATASKRISS